MKKGVLTLISVIVVPIKWVLAVIIGIIVVLTALSNTQAASYTYTTLNYPGATHTEAWDINDAGTIVGWYENRSDEMWETHGFALDGTTWTPLDYPGATWTFPHGINKGGKIAGFYMTGVCIGFTLSGATYIPLEIHPGASETYVYRINDADTVVGHFVGSPGSSFTLSGTTYTLLDYSPSWTFTPYDINNDETIVGTYIEDADRINHGRSLSGTTWTTLDYPGATNTYAYGINNVGTIIGAYEDTSGNTHGFSYDGITWTTLDYPGATYTEAHGINDKGMIVGMYRDATGTHGFLATPPPILTVVLEGVTSGLVMSNPSGISCEPDCSEGFTAGTLVTITATLYPGSAFSHWSGGCSGTINTCTLIMTEDATVTAHFVSDETKEYKLKVKKAMKNGGDGTVTSNDENIDCGVTCTHTYYKDTVVTLSASANGSSTFLGWKSGSLNCIGTDPCTVTIDKARTVQAVFVGDYRLKVVNQSKKEGTGTVTSTPLGINCITGSSAGCEALYGYGEEVTLSASADTGSNFLGWAPAKLCPGTGVCIVPMDKKRTVKAVFAGQ
jgi:probable HAF family extracellular repeat protein